MVSAFGPGDWVECISSCGPDDHGNYVASGSLYQIEFIAPFNRLPGNPDGDGVKLVGVGRSWPGLECLWVKERFRPIYRPNASIIEALKQPLPDLVDA